MEYHLSSIAQIVHGELVGNDATVRHVLTDSRSLLYPDDSLFFAISSDRNDGHRYISDLQRQGVKCFVVKPDFSLKTDSHECSFIVVNDVLKALQQLAAQHRRRFMTPVIGITGSNGKTVVKEWIFQAVRQEKRIVRSPKSYNSQIGVPLSILLLDESHDLAVFEAGISQKGEMERLQTMIAPDIGIFTHPGEAHQENFVSRKEKFSEKLKLFRRCRTLIYCRNHSEIADIVENDDDYKAVSRFSWAFDTDADVVFTRIADKQTATGSSLECKHSLGCFTLHIPFADEASLENALHVVALMLLMAYPSETIAQRIAQLTPVAMRLDLKKGTRNCTIINDAYNADTGSLSIALNLLAHQQQCPTQTVILSDILQSGKSQDYLYVEIAELLQNAGVKRLIGIGAEISAHSELFTCEKRFFASTEDFLKALGNDIRFANEAILVKGSRIFGFERIVQALEDKVNKTVMEINLSAVVHNFNYFKSLLHPGVKMAVMVKAFAYGNGSAEIANVLQYHRADYLAVAFADEGKELRDNGITIPIMVMNPEESSVDTLIRYRLEPEIYNFRMLHHFTQALSDHVIEGYPIHIKLDTGMHRLGFLPHEIKALAATVASQSYVRIKSAFSHLAGSDDATLDYFVNEQINTFKEMSARLEAGIGYSFIRHILNSAGIERFPDAQFDMVRLGIGLHGFSAIDDSKLRQVAALSSVIIQIKDIPAGESVGYNRKFMATKPTRIGIVPIGYADGLHRTLGNGTATFTVNGQQVATVGNISMDVCAVDLTGTDAKEGDTVCIFGENAPLSQLARQMQTIPYEVLTRIAPRVKRIYFQE